ncbi:MAG TPA: glycerophosphodiester phosphodiesterase [Candidatus Binataceae bacterium]|nr:glycerophosphodiester phosphodiesterase [Candidatus Binataceae bacterium]
MLNIAHRGASGKNPENTLSAFRAAIGAGADMCELDAHLTRDGAIVVMHDDAVDRTTDGTGAIASLTLAELKHLDAAAKFPTGAFRGERIPTLDEVFAVMAGRCGLNIELKAPGMERQISAMMRANSALENSIVSSFHWKTLEKIRAVDPEIRIALLAQKDPAQLLDAAARMKAYSINPRFDMVTHGLCASAHERNLKVLAWTVDDPEAMRILIDAGVDGIITNYPDRLAAVLGR